MNFQKEKKSFPRRVICHQRQEKLFYYSPGLLKQEALLRGYHAPPGHSACGAHGAY